MISEPLDFIWANGVNPHCLGPWESLIGQLFLLTQTALLQPELVQTVDQFYRAVSQLQDGVQQVASDTLQQVFPAGRQVQTHTHILSFALSYVCYDSFTRVHTLTNVMCPSVKNISYQKR